MKNIILILFVLLAVMVKGQTEKRILLGLNLSPILANSYEIIGTYSISKEFEISLKFGYAGKNGLRFIQLKGDYIENKTHSGFFAKSGIRFISKFKFFISTDLIFSQYVNTGTDNSFNPPIFLKSRGEIFGIGATTGYRKEILKDKIFLDIGLQIAFAQKRNDYVGFIGHNYQPGLGVIQGNPYFQGIFALMIKIF